MIKQVLQKIENKQTKIGIVGMGYVGLPLAIRFNESGYSVVGLDIDENKVTKLNKGQSYIAHLSAEPIAKMVKSGRFKATTDYSTADSCDALIICVPTPLTRQREPDMTFIVNTMESLKDHLREGQILSLESTTYPGTTDEVLKPYADRKNLKIGENFFLVFSPEREDPGNPNFHTQTIPKVCGGYTENCQKAGVALYSGVINKVVPVSSTRAAEMTKLLENIHRAVNIGLVNEMKMVCDKMGLDIHEIIRAAATKPFGFVPYYPGPGLGGHCIPIDPFYLTWKAREYGINTRFIELAGEVNTHMPHWVVGKVAEALNERGKSIKGSKILVVGISYKKNVDDMRESPSVELMEILRNKKADVQFSDYYFTNFPKMREHSFDLKSVDLTPETIKKYDCVLIATNHDKFDYQLIKEHAQLIVDTRGIYQEPSSKIVKA